MAFTFNAGLRIRPPEPLPACVDGMSAQDYFSLVLSLCSLESATTAENASGDPAPTPFNLGQIQSDLAVAQEDIVALQNSDLNQQTAIDEMQGQFASGVGEFATGDTQTVIELPEDGVWRVFVQATNAELPGLFVDNVSATSATVHFTAATTAGNFFWFAIKVSS
jgi:hypothetical protein